MTPASAPCTIQSAGSAVGLLAAIKASANAAGRYTKQAKVFIAQKPYSVPIRQANELEANRKMSRRVPRIPGGLAVSDNIDPQVKELRQKVNPRFSSASCASEIFRAFTILGAPPS